MEAAAKIVILCLLSVASGAGPDKTVKKQISSGSSPQTSGPKARNDPFLVSSDYGAPSSDYGAPQHAFESPQVQFDGASSSFDLPPQPLFGLSQSYESPKTYDSPTYAIPSPYSPPSSFASGSPSAYSAGSLQYAGAVPSSLAAVSSLYSAPSSSYSAPSSSYGAPSSSYGAPSSSYGAPSSSYGAPPPSYAGAPSQPFGISSGVYSLSQGFGSGSPPFYDASQGGFDTAHGFDQPLFDQGPDAHQAIPPSGLLSLYNSLPEGFGDNPFERAVAWLFAGVATKKALIIGTLAIIGAITLIIKGLIMLKIIKGKKAIEFVLNKFLKPKEGVLDARTAKMVKLAANVLEQIGDFEEKIEKMVIPPKKGS